MSVQRPRLSGLFLTAAIAAFATACGAAKTSNNPPPTGSGQLAIKLVDAPPAKSSPVDQIWVTIDQVTAHSTADGWVTIPMATPTVTVDLLKLQDNSIDLGFLNLPKGTTITQIRLHVAPGSDLDDTDPHVFLKDGTRKPLKVPSGMQSGIKIHGPWQISECTATAVTLDFDGEKSIFTHPAQQETEWILRPVIRVKLTETLDVGCVPPVTPTGPIACDPATPVCPEGDVCLGATCAGHPGDSCTSGAECISGDCLLTLRCKPSGGGGPCYANTDCANLKCDLTTNKCSLGDTGDPCAAACNDSVCTDSVCAPPPDASPDGTLCETNNECFSFTCNNGVCDLSGEGGPCRDNAGCDPGMTCEIPVEATIGSCVLPVAAG